MGRHLTFQSVLGAFCGGWIGTLLALNSAIGFYWGLLFGMFIGGLVSAEPELAQAVKDAFQSELWTRKGLERTSIRILGRVSCALTIS